MELNESPEYDFRHFIIAALSRQDKKDGIKAINLTAVCNMTYARLSDGTDPYHLWAEREKFEAMYLSGRENEARAMFNTAFPET